MAIRKLSKYITILIILASIVIPFANHYHVNASIDNVVVHEATCSGISLSMTITREDAPNEGVTAYAATSLPLSIDSLITATGDYVPGTPGTYTFDLDMTYDMPLGTEIFITLYHQGYDGNPGFLYSYSEQFSYICSEASVSTGPGPEMVSLPESAAVGMFIADTTALWAPDPMATTDVIFEAGKTAWVLGLDESGSYYQIVYVGTYLWVPVGSLAPNPDDVWHGAPLPTTQAD